MNVPLQINLASELQELKENTTVIVACFPGVSHIFSSEVLSFSINSRVVMKYSCYGLTFFKLL